MNDMTPKAWRRERAKTSKRRTLRSAGDLVTSGLAAGDRLAELEAVAARYAVAITPHVAGLIDRHDPADPVARQFVPDAAELTTAPEELVDPIGDDAHEVTKGLVHRYPDRVLLKLVSVCPVYCRFCFRRETVGQGGSAVLADVALEAALAYIRNHEEIWEVILSGGDPLIASPRRLRTLGEALATIGHVKVVRFHTRMPVVDPSQISVDLVSALTASGKAIWLAVHANHPRELTVEARAALARLADGGMALVSQTVLLKGVNDAAETLSALMRALVESRVKPYYLHHGDLAPGTAHFRTTIAEGQSLMRAMHGKVSGLCQPTYVLDIPGGHGKAPIGPQWIARCGQDYEVEDFRGAAHLYRDKPAPASHDCHAPPPKPAHLRP